MYRSVKLSVSLRSLLLDQLSDLSQLEFEVISDVIEFLKDIRWIKQDRRSGLYHIEFSCTYILYLLDYDMGEIKLRGFICERCNHKWLPRENEFPKVCPTCKSQNWNTQRKLNKPKLSLSIKRVLK
jgi:hypothetical protein